MKTEIIISLITALGTLIAPIISALINARNNKTEKIKASLALPGSYVIKKPSFLRKYLFFAVGGGIVAFVIGLLITSPSSSPVNEKTNNIFRLNTEPFADARFNILGSLNRQIGYLSKNSAIVALPTNRFSLGQNGKRVQDCSAVNVYNSDSNIDTTFAMEFVNTGSLLFINSVDFVLEGFDPLLPSDIERYYERSGFGGGPNLIFHGDGGNVRPEKGRVDVWGSAGAIRVEPYAIVYLSFPVRFQETGVYTYHLEINAQDQGGDFTKYITKPASYGWLITFIEPSEIILEGTISSSDGYSYMACE